MIAAENAPEWKLIEVSNKAVQNHLAHGDGFPLGDVPDMAGNVFGENCETAAAQPDLTITKEHTAASFTQGSTGNIYTVIVTNNGAGTKTAGQSVSVTDTPPSGLTVTAMSGAGWTCTTLPVCARTDILAPSASYLPLIVTVSVAANATSPQVNAVFVTTAQTESNNGNNTATDSTVILAAARPDLTVTKTHTEKAQTLMVNRGMFSRATSRPTESSTLHSNGRRVDVGCCFGTGRTSLGASEA